MLTSSTGSQFLAMLAVAFGIQGSTQVAIMDPVLDRRAWTLTIPAGWTADGAMLPGSSCNNGTSPIYRATSADGKYGAYLLPRTDWAWSRNVRHAEDCTLFHEAVSAKDYLTYFIRVRDVGFVNDVPVPADEMQTMQSGIAALNERGRGQMRATGDMARARVRYGVAGQEVEEDITATITCTDAIMGAIGHQNSCTAFITRRYAPVGKLEQAAPIFATLKLALDQSWMSEWSRVAGQRIAALSKQQTDAMLEQGRVAQAQRMQQHREFMAGMARGRDLRNQQFREGQYRKTKNKEDYVDHILDCQRMTGRHVTVAVGNCPVRETQ